MPNGIEQANILRKIRIYWNNQSIWLPFVYIALVPIIVLMNRGAVNQLFGKDADFSKRISVTGRFTPRGSSIAPYVFEVDGGRKIELACAPRRKKQLCLDDFGIYESAYRVTYVPFKLGWPHTADGLVLELARGSQIVIPERVRLLELRGRPTSGIVLGLLVLIRLLSWAPLLLLTAFLGIGAYGSCERLAGR